MPAYNFKDRFVLPIELGTKQQTIRAPRKDGWLPGAGMLLQLQRGDRFHPVRIGLARCMTVEAIVLNFRLDTVAYALADVAGGVRTVVAPDRLDEFARLDGFADWSDLRKFWDDTHPGPVFTGTRIFWGGTFAGPLDPPPADLAG